MSNAASQESLSREIEEIKLKCNVFRSLTRIVGWKIQMVRKRNSLSKSRMPSLSHFWINVKAGPKYMNVWKNCGISRNIRVLFNEEVNIISSWILDSKIKGNLTHWFPQSSIIRVLKGFEFLSSTVLCTFKIPSSPNPEFFWIQTN